MPTWFLHLRRNRVVNDLRRHLPADVRRILRRTVQLGPARRIESADAALVDRFRSELAEDAKRFREMTGMPFTDWTV